MRKRLTVLSLIAVGLVIAGLGSMASGQSGTYTGTIYAAGQGGHMAVVEVTIDPSNTQNPIAVNALRRIKLGNSPISKPEDYITHDPRIDTARGKMYWSTIWPDSDGMYRYGRVDLTSKRTECDIQMQVPARSAAGSPPGFCGSGQSADYFLPVWMGYEGFVDVIKKDTCEREDRVYLDAYAQGMPVNYMFAHGTNKDDFSTMTIVENLASTPGSGLNWSGREINLDMNALVSGQATVTKVGPVIQGPPGTIFFRQDWTPDGSKLLQGGRAISVVLDSNLNESCRYQHPVINGHQVENHDITAVGNSGYAVMQLRQWDMRNGVAIMDGKLQLFDIANCQPVGQPVSMCFGCHDKNNVLGNKPNQQNPGKAPRVNQNLVTCGIDSVWN